MTSPCAYAGADRPRVILGRHDDQCADRHDTDANGCRGCEPCTEPHCRICGHAHADETCAECLADVRANLHDIGRMCNALPAEAEHRGVNSEAAMLLGPTADPERIYDPDTADPNWTPRPVGFVVRNPERDPILWDGDQA